MVSHLLLHPLCTLHSVHFPLCALSAGLVCCVCLLLAQKQKMDNFLDTYKNELRRKNIGLHEFTDEQLRTVLSAVVLLLRRHSIDNRLCTGSKCRNDSENNLEVTAVDKYGFVTEVRCTECDQHINTTCYDAKWTIERIHDERHVKKGDHICWQRPCAYWHHAIVTTDGENEVRVVHYPGIQAVTETTFSKAKASCCRTCDTLYRINYQDCYNADYTVLRAQKLLYENRYDLFRRNCEHFSSWCKTGSTKSKQVSIFWASFGKIVITSVLRLTALFILFLIQWSHEELEQKSRRQKILETVLTMLTCIYLCGVTLLFVIYLLVTSGSKLAVDPRSTKLDDPENPCSCVKLYDYCTNDRCSSWRCFCCTACSCYTLFCGVVIGLFTWCKHITCSPFTCCRRPGNVACGLFFRIFFREVPGLIVTICIVVFEDKITSNKSAIVRTGILMAWIVGAQIFLYAVGAICLGRWVEAACDNSDCSQCCTAAQSNNLLQPENQINIQELNS